MTEQNTRATPGGALPPEKILAGEQPATQIHAGSLQAAQLSATSATATAGPLLSEADALSLALQIIHASGGNPERGPEAAAILQTHLQTRVLGNTVDSRPVATLPVEEN